VSPRAESASIETLLLEAELRYALARVERSESRLAAGVLRAPAAGVVDRRYRGEGEAVPAGAPVVRLSELGNVVARASLPRALRPLLRIGGPAVVRVASDAADGLPAEIARVGGETGGANAEVAFEVRVENPSGVLRPGGVVAVEVAVEGPEALYTIPLSAVLRGIDARPFSFVVIGRGARARVERRHLVLGGFEGDRVAVVEGLAVGDRVVTRGQDLVTVGDPVAIVGEGP
jgi:membrane fusion protein (multidrug efflux system)